jgi:hypothetical protein
MKESIFHFVLALALLALTQNAQAESYKGTMERHDVIRDIKETSYGKNPTGTKAVIKRLNR